MFKKGFLFSIIFIVFIFCGCDYFGPGMSDYSYHVSKKYEMCSPSANQRILYKEDEHNSNLKRIVDNMVTGIAWDKQFILVEQTKNKSKSYWIIDINKDKVYEQLSLTDFDKQRNLLKVDSSLKLENPDKYKNLDPSSK